MKDPQETDLVIPIMGATGAGKSSFVNALSEKVVAKVGHDLQSETSQLQHFVISHRDFPTNRRVIVVDTPGFDDTNEDDREILRRIAVWLARSYSARMKLAGVIYLHEITQTRMLGTARKNLDMFQKLCGDQATKNTVLVTTKWSNINKEVGMKREEQLKDEHWKQMFAKGSRMARLNPPEEDAFKIVMSIIRNELPDRGALEIQRELVDVDKFLAQTEAGKTLSYTLKQLLENQRLMAERLRKEGNADDVYHQIKENDEKIQNLVKQIQTLKLSWTTRFKRWLGIL